MDKYNTICVTSFQCINALLHTIIHVYACDQITHTYLYIPTYLLGQAKFLMWVQNGKTKLLRLATKLHECLPTKFIFS